MNRTQRSPRRLRSSKQCASRRRSERGSSLTVREGFRILDFELEQRMTRRQINLIAFTRIPTADNQAARIRVRFDFINQTRDLIEAVRLWIMAAEGTPKVSIHRPEIAGLATETPRVLGIGPFLPNIDPGRPQVGFVGVAGQKPEQLFSNPSERNLLCRDDGKALAQIKARLKSKVRDRADTSPIFVLSAVLED